MNIRHVVIRELFWVVLAAGTLICNLAPCLPAEAPRGNPIEVGKQKHLFFDDYLVASASNVVRRIHAAEKSKANPVIRQTEPWEDPFNILYGSVIRDGEKY